MPQQNLRHFHKTYIQGVPPGIFVTPEMYLITQLSSNIQDRLNLFTARVYIGSVALKHIYEKRTAYEYDVILDQLELIIHQPDAIYANADHKLADYIFTKQINEVPFLCLLKTNAHPEVGQEVTVVVSAYRTNQKYLRKFELIQNWKDG